MKDDAGTPRFAGLVLSAGRGSRMGGSVPKVLRPVGGRPMVAWVVDALRQAGIGCICVVVSPDGARVREAIGSSVLYAVQQVPRGSGDAAACGRAVLEGRFGAVIVACGDSPLLSAETVRRVMRSHDASGAVVTLLSARLDDPTGYGRIVRDGASGRITAIVEERDATDETRAVREVNGGLYAFDSSFIWARLGKARPAIHGSEFVLTELVADAVREGLRVESVPCDADEIQGVNTPEQLAAVEAILASRASLGQQVEN